MDDATLIVIMLLVIIISWGRLALNIAKSYREKVPEIRRIFQKNIRSILNGGNYYFFGGNRGMRWRGTSTRIN
jgi:hypothetical protein